jgi:hypothetical protein
MAITLRLFLMGHLACTSELLLFIALAVDKEGKGVPLALFLFSAPMGN